MDQFDPYSQPDPNADLPKPLTSATGEHKFDFNQVLAMKNAAGNAVSWFNQLTSYVEKNPGIALGVGAGILLMALSSMEQGNKGQKE